MEEVKKFYENLNHGSVKTATPDEEEIKSLKTKIEKLEETIERMKDTHSQETEKWEETLKRGDTENRSLLNEIEQILRYENKRLDRYVLELIKSHGKSLCRCANDTQEG